MTSSLKLLSCVCVCARARVCVCVGGGGGGVSGKGWGCKDPATPLDVGPAVEPVDFLGSFYQSPPIGVRAPRMHHRVPCAQHPCSPVLPVPACGVAACHRRADAPVGSTGGTTPLHATALRGRVHISRKPGAVWVRPTNAGATCRRTRGAACM